MSEMKSAVGAGMDRSGDDLCVENSVREFKIWADVLNYGKKILKNAGIVEADPEKTLLRSHRKLPHRLPPTIQAILPWMGF